MRTPPRSVLTATLVGVAAATVTSPIALATSLWVGGGAVAVGVRDAAGAYAVAGILIILAASLTITLWACIPGIVRARHRPRVVALVVLMVLLALSFTRAWPAVVASWLPRPLAWAALAIAMVALVMALLARRPAGEPVAGVAPAIAGLVGAYVVVAVVAALPGTGIPQFPRLPWVASLQVEGPPGAPVVALPVAANPALAPGEWANIHHDSWMTDTYSAVRLPDPATSEVTSFFAGGDCASLLWNDEGDIVAMCVSPTEVRAYILDPRTLTPRMERSIAERTLAADALTNFSGGGYAVLDVEQRVVTPLPGGVIARYDARTLDAVDSFDVAGLLQSGEGITSVVPDFSGLLWFVGRQGTVGLLDPVTGVARSLLAGPGGEPIDIENSFAVTEQGAYVVTGAELLLIAAEDGEPVINWRVPYDVGTRLKPGQTSRASGTTPTVFGEDGRFVAITDNADPRMHVIVYDVSGPAPREHCSVPVFGDGMSATENSLIALGDSIIVESNYGYTVTAVAGGHTTVPGLARIDVLDVGCALAWETSEVTIPSLVSKGVLADGAVLTYTKDRSALGLDAWWFTAVDAQTGDVRWRRLAGVGPLLNNHYAAGYIGPDGSVYVGTISGLVGLVRAG